MKIRKTFYDEKLYKIVSSCVGSFLFTRFFLFLNLFSTTILDKTNEDTHMLLLKWYS